MNPAWLESHPSAVAEARAAWRWYPKRNHAVANGFKVELDRAESRITTAPHQWPQSPEQYEWNAFFDTAVTSRMLGFGVASPDCRQISLSYARH
jgi:hypothetical protein